MTECPMCRGSGKVGKIPRVTPGALRLWEYYRSFRELRGYSPTMAEAARSFGVCTQTIEHHLLRLQQAGYIVREPNKQRGVVAIDPPKWEIGH